MNKKGFLFIEGSLLTLTAMTGIVAAVLFPSVAKYLSSGRDTSRIVGVNQMSTAIMSYTVSHQGQLPAVPKSGCVPTNLLTQEMPSSLKDPQGKKATGCTGSESDFAYRTFISKDGVPMYMVGVDVEDYSKGNSTLSVDELLALPNRDEVMMQGLTQQKGKYYIRIQ